MYPDPISHKHYSPVSRSPRGSGFCAGTIHKIETVLLALGVGMRENNHTFLQHRDSVSAQTFGNYNFGDFRNNFRVFRRSEGIKMGPQTRFQFSKWIENAENHLFQRKASKILIIQTSASLKWLRGGKHSNPQLKTEI